MSLSKWQKTGPFQKWGRPEDIFEQHENMWFQYLRFGFSGGFVRKVGAHPKLATLTGEMVPFIDKPISQELGERQRCRETSSDLRVTIRLFP